MNQLQSSIVVGIDGSEAAVNAARWAVSEATSRDVPLRLVHVVPTIAGSTPDMDLQYAETTVRAAEAAVHDTDQSLKVETAVVRGSAGEALIDESRYAAMTCVGSLGIGRLARRVLGSTAATLAQKAYCPVAVIRTDDDASPPPCGWVAVAVDESPGNDAVLELGFREARLRDAPILALGIWRWGLGEIPYDQLNHRLGRWVSRYPDVHVRPKAARRGAAEFLAHSYEPIQVAIVGSRDAGNVARIIGPVTHGFFEPAGYSVLVVRN